jgi:hypothetical protein
MGRVMGIEPTAFGTTTRRSNQLSYTRHTCPLLLDDYIRKAVVDKGLAKLALGSLAKPCVRGMFPWPTFVVSVFVVRRVCVPLSDDARYLHYLQSANVDTIRREYVVLLSGDDSQLTCLRCAPRAKMRHVFAKYVCLE